MPRSRALAAAKQLGGTLTPLPFFPAGASRLSFQDVPRATSLFRLQDSINPWSFYFVCV